MFPHNVQVVEVTGVVAGSASGRSRRTPPPRSPAPPLEVRRVPAAALEVALELAGGDRGRLRFDQDGGVVVANAHRI